MKKPVYFAKDLSQFGIEPLTGEACAYSIRILCDLNEDGADAVAEFFGMGRSSLAGPWNSQANGQPSVASILLPRSIIKELTTFLFYRDGALAVVITRDSAITPVYDEETLGKWVDLGPEFGHTVMRNPRPSGPGRNTHAFTGRTF